VKFAFIREHLSAYPARVCCRVLGVSRSGFYHAFERPRSARRIGRELLVEQVASVHRQSRRAYGSWRVARELTRRGVPVCRNTVARIMRESGLKSRRCARSRPRTTDSSRTLMPAPNLLRRLDKPTHAGQVWVADITYIRTREGFVYLAAVMDLGTRQIVGWSLDGHLHAHLAARALAAAVARHPPPPGLVHHSDRGVQYASVLYRERLRTLGMVRSMSRRGDCYDNAAMESFFASLKTELIGAEVYHNLDHARDEVMRYIEGFYNPHRLHSALNYRPPDRFHRDTIRQ
jgi:putative transposase